MTNGQYQAFMDDGGYGERKWWSDAGWAWLQKERVTEPLYWRDRRWDAPNQPVVGVSFWEAEACSAGPAVACRESRNGRPPRAAPRATRTPGARIGRTGNTGEGGVGVTSPVGLFPRSRQARLEIDDLAGNVWEWCQSLWSEADDASKPDAPRVLRGGSWGGFQVGARCAIRYRASPSGRDYDVGFRVVCSSPITNH